MKNLAFVVIVLVLFITAAASGETVYFLVAEANSPVHGDSYVLPLTEPNDIAHARDLVKLGPSAGEPIVVAQIECSRDCINRDYYAYGKPPFSWHVSDFNNFADSTIEVLDGWPGLVESNCTGWVADTGGYIGFWTYTVVDELGTDPNHWDRDFDGDAEVDFIDYAMAADFDLDSLAELKVFAEAWLSPYAQQPALFPIGPDCWNWPYQCYGYADGQTETILKYRVWINDADILSTCWKKKDTDPAFNGCACADFNRDGDIDEADAAILNANVGKKDSDFAQTCTPYSQPCTPE